MLGIGIYVCHGGIRAATIEKIEDKFIIKKLINTEFDNEIINGGNIELQEQFVSYLGRLVLENSLNKKKAAISYFNQKVNFRNLSLPMMNERELKKAIQWQIIEDLAMSSEELVYDYSIVNIEDEKYNILAVVAKKDDLFKYMSLVVEAGVNIGIIDLPNSACIYPMSRDFLSNESYTVVLDIGYDTSDITFLVKDNISFARNLNLGIRRLIKLLSSETPYRMEEILKDSELLEKNYIYFEDFYSSLSNEIQNSIWFYESNFVKNRSAGSASIKNLVLDKYAVELPKFKNYLENIPILKKCKVANWEPELKLFETEKENINWPMYNTAIGLAMRSAEND